MSVDDSSNVVESDYDTIFGHVFDDKDVIKEIPGVKCKEDMGVFMTSQEG